ncbi:MAG: hypothetical protein JWN10_326 [Solirubrobacterales bacterium]|nr:hypothetical protein [Solirubrobacterales bacterium]
MPDPDPHPRAARSARPPDELVLAAVERAGRHQARPRSGVPAWAILEHLALRPRSAPARHVRSRLDALHAAGSLECTRRHGVPTWALTAAGRRRLRRAMSAGEPPALPESPQHRAWRNARTAAGQELERFRRLLGERLQQATALLDADPPPHSDAWLELTEELQRGCRRLASASHCLYEWAEPDDGRADLDEHVEPDDRRFAPAQRKLRRVRRAGRRNILLWEDGADG